MRTLILMISLATMAQAKDVLQFTVSTTPAETRTALVQALADDRFAVKEDKGTSVTLERHVDVTIRGYERVRLEFDSAQGSTIVSVQAWEGYKSGMTIGVKRGLKPDQIQRRYDTILKQIQALK